MNATEVIASDDIDDDSVIVSLQYLLLKDDKGNGLLKANENADESIMLDTG